MLIVCPSCATSYDLSAKALGAGRSVRCARCKTTWFATAEAPQEQASAAAAAAAADAASFEAPPPAPEPPPEPAPPSFDEMPDEMAGTFTVDGVLPPDPDAEAADAAADPFAMADSPSIVPGSEETPQDGHVEGFDPGAPDEPTEPENIESLAARRARRAEGARKGKKSLLRKILSLPVLIVILLAAVVAAIQGRQTVVKHLPQTASLYAMLGMPVNLRGLEFVGVKSTGEFNDGMMVLVVEGNIVNVTRQALDVPRLRFAMRSGAGHEVYAWTALPSKTQLAPGESLPFRSRLASPPPDGKEVIVRFFNRRDVIAGAR
jgi:predicted Zn finger-like uncharacterized protein